MAPSPEQITQMLVQWRDGDESALAELIPLVYSELLRLARHYMRGERPDHSLQASALVNEAYLRLVDHKDMRWQNRCHFYAVAAQAMRRVLVDHARSRNYAKRGGGGRRIELEQATNLADKQAGELVALDDALSDLARLDPRKCQVVEMRYFGGMSIEETAEALGVSPATVTRDWSTAKAWLLRQIANRAVEDQEPGLTDNARESRLTQEGTLDDA